MGLQKGSPFLQRVRERLKEYEEESIRVLDGKVEVDETYFGTNFKKEKEEKGKAKDARKVKRGRGAKKLKQPVFGIYEREDWIVYIKPVADVKKDTLQNITKLLKHHGVSPNNFLSYLKEKEFRFNHRDLKNEELVDKMLEVLLQGKHSTKR